MLRKDPFRVKLNMPPAAGLMPVQKQLPWFSSVNPKSEKAIFKTNPKLATKNAEITKKSSCDYSLRSLRSLWLKTSGCPFFILLFRIYGCRPGRDVTVTPENRNLFLHEPLI
jgi:hypothetical protein